MSKAMMLEEVVMASSWSEGSDDDGLVRDLLVDSDDGSHNPPLMLQPGEEEPNNNNTIIRRASYSADDDQLAINSSISNIYSGPTISDIENALSVTNSGNQTQHFQHLSSSAASRISIMERGLSKTENKYTLKIKCFGNGMGDDGYKWRKYGQKSIKNSSNPRSYYRCTNPRCSAKKQVERSNEDPDTLIITYEGLHLHFAYPYFLTAQSHQSHSDPPIKKPKAQAQHVHEAQEAQSVASLGLMPSTLLLDSSEDHTAQENLGSQSQGLLEDMVPFMVRNPTTNDVNCAHSKFSCSSCNSPPTSPPSLWSSSYSTSYYTVGLNSTN